MSRSAPKADKHREKPSQDISNQAQSPRTNASNIVHHS
jgi:hypothetical protein